MQTLLKALLALVLSSSSLCSETVYGQGSTTAYEWVMSNVIPDALGLKVNGIYHKYTITKDTEANATVTICNKNINAEGCAYLHTDNWNGLPSTTKIFYDPVALLGATLGDGSMKVTGDATLSDPIVYYDWFYDTCADPITDPRCPGYDAALLKYLTDNGLFDDPDFEDPYYNEFVKAQREAKAELDKEEAQKKEEIEEEEKDEETLEEMLSVEGGRMDKIVSAAQQSIMLAALSNTPALDSYYALELNGGEYKERLVLPDNEIVDNKKALRSLQTDTKMREMVRSQYDK